MWQTLFKYLVVDATGKRKLLWKLKMANPLGYEDRVIMIIIITILLL
jgi:hypothetical protein